MSAVKAYKYIRGSRKEKIVNMFRLSTTASSALLALVVLVFSCVSGPARAAVLLEGNGATAVAGSNETTGTLELDNDRMTGWRSSIPGDSEVDAEYLYFDLSRTPLNPEEGSIVATLYRGEKYSTEAVFSLADEKRHRMWVFQVEWNDPVPAVRIYDTGPGHVLPGGLIPFPGPVAPGDKVEIAVSWKIDRFVIRINGVALAVTPIDIEDFRDTLRRAKYLIVGAETDSDIPGGAWSQMNSLLTAFTVHDVFGVFRNTRPVVKSVSHNIFSVAGYSGKLVAGDKFTVTVVAEPGGTATFDLGPIQDHVMTEDPDKPGTYTGVHIVKYGEDVEDDHVVGYFVDNNGIAADSVAVLKPVTVDTRVYMDVKTSNDLMPADEKSKVGVTVVAKNANGVAVRKHPLLFTLSTTDEYTGILGGGTFEKMVGGEIDVDWNGVTDSFGEVTAQYLSGFAAKTILVSARDMVSGDVGVGYVRSYIDGTVDVLVRRPRAVALGLAGSMDVTASRDWLTADGSSRSRITAVVKDRDGSPVEGDQVKFTLLGTNGFVNAIKSLTDSRGRATADYIAGTVIGQVQIEVRDMTAGHSAVISIELRSDAPAEVALSADPGEVFTDDKAGSVITAKVTDANGNPNFNTDVLFEVASGSGSMSAPKAVTDEKGGIASVNFLPGSEPGVSTIKATVISRAPTADEIAAAEGAVFLYGLANDPGRLEVVEWYAEPGDDVVEGEDLLKLEDRHGTFYTVKSPREGTLATFVAEERDRVEYGQTLGYVLPVPE